MRNIYSCGLIAGLSMREMKHMTPGFIMDMYFWRMDYESRMYLGKSLRQLMGRGD